MTVIKLHPERYEYEKAETAFLCAVGVCVTRWAFIDRCLYNLFCFCLQTGSLQTATIYYNQKTLSQRLRFVENLMEHALTKQYLKNAWSKILAELTDLIPTRNIIVHHPVKRLGTSKKNKAIYVYSIYIEPNERRLNRKHKGLRGKAELGTKELQAHASAVDRLERKIRSFNRRLTKLRIKSGV